MPVAEVEGAVEELLAVGADVEHDGQGAARVDAGGGGVDGELADGDVDAAHAPVADAEDALAVGGDDQVDVVGAEAGGAQGAFDVVGGVHGQVDPTGAPVLVAVALDGRAHGGGVDDGQHLLEVVADQPVEQHLVAVVEGRQVDVLGQVAGLLPELGIGAVGLLVLGEHARRHEADQAQGPALLIGERGSPVEPGVGQDGPSPGRDPQGLVGGVPLGRLVPVGRHGSS
ncbi:hypothetical protein SAV14893_032530 [Streptomyces avermitilis]|uniref:Uncharacterized protein n=1 Tax=Streptomyces avermitilis TaxID=33903 RepID=A0A4D4LWE4_STRAX|nr:hypothetical protein SAV14893_032530 [Streptomyces avermitilis]